MYPPHLATYKDLSHVRVFTGRTRSEGFYCRGFINNRKKQRKKYLYIYLYICTFDANSKSQDTSNFSREEGEFYFVFVGVQSKYSSSPGSP